MLVNEFVRSSEEDRYEDKEVLWDVDTRNVRVLPKNLYGKAISYENKP